MCPLILLYDTKQTQTPVKTSSNNSFFAFHHYIFRFALFLKMDLLKQGRVIFHPSSILKMLTNQIPHSSCNRRSIQIALLFSGTTKSYTELRHIIFNLIDFISLRLNKNEIPPNASSAHTHIEHSRRKPSTARQ